MPLPRLMICHLLLTFILAAPWARAAEKTTVATQASKKETTAATKPATFDEAVAGYEKIPGWFTFYRKAAAGETSLLLELREEQLAVPFFLEATFATGDGGEVMNGEPVQNFVLEWQRTPDDRLLLVTPILASAPRKARRWRRRWRAASRKAIWPSLPSKHGKRNEKACSSM